MFSISTLFSSTTFMYIFKIGGLLGLILYLLFLLVILKQIRSMNTIITQPYLFPVIQIALYVLIVFTVFIFVLGVVIL